MLVFTMSKSDASSTGQAGFIRRRERGSFADSSERFHLSTLTWRDGGARRDRTDDLMLAKHALSQLSYGPTLDDQNFKEAQTLRLTPDGA